MDLELTSGQQLVQSTARHFLERESVLARVRDLVDELVDEDVDRDLWRRAAELGWFAPFVAEADGGGSVSGAPAADAAIVVEEAGRAVLSGPLIPANVVAFAIARSGSVEQRGAYLAGLIDGTTVATWAFAEPSGRWDADGARLEAKPSGGEWVLSGVKSYVQSAESADLFLVTARHDGRLVQFLVPRDAPGVSVVPLDSLDLARRFAEVHFSEARLPAQGQLGADASEAVEQQLELATVLVCAETVGAVTTKAFLGSRRLTIASGTSEIQRNNISERALGLPRETAPDRDRPFNEVVRD